MVAKFSAIFLFSLILICCSKIETTECKVIKDKAFVEVSYYVKDSKSNAMVLQETVHLNNNGTYYKNSNNEDSEAGWEFITLCDSEMHEKLSNEDVRLITEVAIRK